MDKLHNMEIVFHEAGYDLGYYNCFFCGKNYKVQLIDPLLIVVRRGKIIGNCCLNCLLNDPKRSLFSQAKKQLEKDAAKLRKIARSNIKSVKAEEYFEKQEEIAEEIQPNLALKRSNVFVIKG